MYVYGEYIFTTSSILSQRTDFVNGEVVMLFLNLINNSSQLIVAYAYLIG